MLSNRLVFAALAMACVTAAGAGGYLATRQANQPTEAAAPVATQTAGTDAASAPAVRETEAPVTPAAPAAPLPAATATTTATPATAAATEPGPAVDRSAAVTAPTKKAPAATATRAPQAQSGRAQTSVARTPDRVATELPRTVPPTQAAAPEPVTSTNDLPATSASADNRPSVADQAPVAEALPSTAVNPVGQINFEELTVSADSVIGLELDRAISSDRARVEDRVEARVARDVRVGRRVAIPAGAKALGSVMTVERGGKFKERARLGIRFNTLVLADGTRLPIQTDTIYRYGDAPGDSSAKKIGGGAVAGAILGAIIGGAKGAAVGATAGAGGGTAMVMSGERSAAEFPTGAEVTARILTPVTVTIER